MSRYAFFLGCTTPVRAMNYELSTRRVSAKLGIELVDLPFSCCGYPIESINRDNAMLMSMRNFALAESKRLDIVTVCSACAGALTRFSNAFAEDEASRTKVADQLKSVGLEYKGSVKVRHFARVLYEDIGVAKLKEAATKDLKGLKVLTHYGCHYVRPSESYRGFDDPEIPHTVDELVEATGAESLDVPQKSVCCGAPLLPVDKAVALSMAEVKLQMAQSAKADALVVICPFCGISYDRGQLEIEAEFQRKYGLPVLYLPQLLGLAMGFSPRDLGFMINSVKVQGILDKIQEGKP
jgi:heterodisulfide reductase subunit B